jgi:nucleoside triphosphatase
MSGDQAYPEPTSGVLIFNPAGEILLVQSHKWKGKYVLPGGHIELGERAVDAARREAKEETGLDVYDIQFLGWQEFIYDQDFWKPRHFIFLDFTCRTDSTDVRLNDEAQAYCWVKPEKSLDLTIDPYTAVSIRQYLKRASR